MEDLQKTGQGVSAFAKTAMVIVCLFLFSLVTWCPCYADNAEVLPKGTSAVYIEGKFYLPVDERFGPDGDEEKIAEDFNSTLNSSVFPALSQLETAFGVPSGFANVGKSVVSYEYDFNIIEFNYQYGITDKLSLGIKIPYWDVKNNVNASLDTTNATFGKNPLFGVAAPPLGAAPLAPLTLPLPPPFKVQKLTSQDAQNLIGKGLDVNGDGRIDIPGYGFNAIESWSRSGISDIEAGMRYQYYKSDNWRLAFTGGIRFPTGREDDPDSLVDYPFGTGAWAGLFRVHQDYIGTKNLLLSATLKYDLYLPDHKVMRIPDDVERPLTRNKEEVDRDIGDYFEMEISGTYEFYQGLSFYLCYRFGYKWRDDISGSMGYAYNVAEAETNAKEQVYIVGFQYSTLPLYLEKKFPIPIIGFIGYRSRFAGENVLKSDYIDVGLTVLF
jgi:hypothetical protein